MYARQIWEYAASLRLSSMVLYYLQLIGVNGQPVHLHGINYEG